MRRVALIVAMLAVVSISGLPAHAVAQAPTPTLTLEEYCPVIEGQQYYGALASLSGFRRTLPLGSNSRSAPRASAGNFGPAGFAGADGGFRPAN
jgi:hypothetical protein